MDWDAIKHADIVSTTRAVFIRMEPVSRVVIQDTLDTYAKRVGRFCGQKLFKVKFACLKKMLSKLRLWERD